MSRAHIQLPLTRRRFMRLIAGTTAAGIMGNWPALQSLAAEGISLEYRVNAYIRKLRRAGRIPSDEQTAWSVYDFTTGHKLVSINEDQPLQAASMIKPFLAQAYFFRHRANKHRYPYDKRVKLKMESMIRHSDNSAANFFINRIGRDFPVNQRPREVERVLKRHACGIFQQTSIVEFIPHGGRSYRNKASAHDYSRFLCAMCGNRLPYAGEIKHYMGLPNRDRIQDGAAGVSRNVRLYHKTGTTAHLCGDMGVLEAKGRNGRRYRYTFIGIIQKAARPGDYGFWMRDRGNVIREVSGLVYTFMRKRHNLVF
ncbi:Beta-lactamase class A [uncultured Desulfobacterium sp.]|uniref:beta-lactamase n=1 Tax=uncultured Desulfobacterium sp. TaxID=201089 RepID=A0A445N437_9BACT|nr:Beta-lactamase class A [uncultured Desulfobacterium sp.]